MRTRYYSPSSQQNLQQLSRNNKLRKLRSFGSANKINIPSYYQDNYEVNIGAYTYFTNKILGTGYSSKVYLAKKKGDELYYAIKVINLKNYHSINLSLLRNQIQILKTLNHPNVIKCYDIFKSRQHCYIVTQYCSSGDLNGFLSRRGKVNQDTALDIIQQITKGYKYLIGLNIIHRDLKPANILKSGSTWKIADFGFAIFSPQTIKTTENVGTPLYMPLQSLTVNQYSVKSDIFSIGVILYELISGCTPWQSSTQKQLVKKMQSEQLNNFNQLCISDKTRNLLQKFCEINFEERISEDQFLSLNIRSYNPKRKLSPLRYDNKQRISLINQKRDRIKRNIHRSAEFFPNIQSKLSRPTLPDTEQENEYILKKMEIKNNYILVNQLHYCRFLFYFARNRQYFLLSDRDSDKIVMVIYRHLVTLINHLSDKDNNWFKLEQWEKFTESKRYKNTLITIKQYSNRYLKQYNNFIKDADYQMIQETLQDFGNPVQLIQQFSGQYYQKMMNILSSSIKKLSMILSITLDFQKTQLKEEQKGQIEVLIILYKFYELICMGYANDSNYVYFEAQGQIKIYIDYKNSEATISDLLDITKKVENW